MFQGLYKLLKPSKRIPKETIELVIAYLEAGVEFDQIKNLMTLPYDTLEQFCSTVYKDHPQVYLKLKNLFSMPMILRYYSDYTLFKNQLFHQIYQQLSYPLILFVCIYTLMTFFILKIFPMIFSLISSFDITMPMLRWLYYFVVIAYIALTIIVICFVILIVVLLKKQHLKLFVIVCHQYPWFKTFKMIYTQMFAYTFLLIYQLGASTQQILEIMRASTLSYFVGWLSELTTYQLEEGESLIESLDNHFLDDQFISLFQLGRVDNKIKDYLDTFLDLNHKRIFLDIKKISLTLKQITYGLLAILIIIFYQILLSPMQMMSFL